MSEEKKSLVVFVDDIRDPRIHLGKERAVGVVWIKTFQEAADYFHDHQAEITEIHLDEYLGDNPNDLGSELMGLIYCMVYYGNHLSLLKTIYLHSSDTSVIEDLIEEYQPRLSAFDITMVDNHKSGY